MSFFPYAHAFTAKWEGGLIDHPNDPGGITKYGISLRFLKKIGFDVNSDGLIDAADIKGLTPDNAAALMKSAFWDALDLDLLPEALAMIVYDGAVNQGCSRAVSQLQRACNRLDPLNQIAEDGVLGGVTRYKAKRLPICVLTVNAINERDRFYDQLASANPRFLSFIKGWKARTSDLRRAVARLDK